MSVRHVVQSLDGCSLVSPLPVSFPYPGLTVPALPGGLASLSLPGATRLGFPPLPAGVCVLLISNLNPEVSPSLCICPCYHHHHPETYRSKSCHGVVLQDVFLKEQFTLRCKFRSFTVHRRSQRFEKILFTFWPAVMLDSSVAATWSLHVNKAVNLVWDQVVMSLLQTVITADELMETSDVLNQVSAASVVQQNAATLFDCEAPELFCGRPHCIWLYQWSVPFPVWFFLCLTCYHRWSSQWRHYIYVFHCST